MRRLLPIVPTAQSEELDDAVEFPVPIPLIALFCARGGGDTNLGGNELSEFAPGGGGRFHKVLDIWPPICPRGGWAVSSMSSKISNGRVFNDARDCGGGGGTGGATV